MNTDSHHYADICSELKAEVFVSTETHVVFVLCNSYEQKLWLTI